MEIMVRAERLDDLRRKEIALEDAREKIDRLRSALAQIRDAAHENGVAWTQRVASKALEDV